MTSRIDWNSSAVSGGRDGGDSKEQGEPNSCALVWTGTAPTRHFSGFRFEDCATPAAARRFLHTKGLAHYWDMALQHGALVAGTNMVPLPGFATMGGGDDGVDVEGLFAGGRQSGSDSSSSGSDSEGGGEGVAVAAP